MKNKLVLVITGALLLGGIAGYFVFRGRTQDAREPGPGLTSRPEPAQISGSFTKGQKAPDVSFTDFDGNRHQLSDFARRVVVLDFWAAWCPFCLAEMPELQRAQDQYGEDLVMIGVHRTDTESAATGLEFAQDRGVSYLLVTDIDGTLYRAAGGFGMPVAVFIDKEQVVQEVKSGPKTAEEIEEKVGKLIE